MAEMARVCRIRGVWRWAGRVLGVSLPDPGRLAGLEAKRRGLIRLGLSRWRRKARARRGFWKWQRVAARKEEIRRLYDVGPNWCPTAAIRLATRVRELAETRRRCAGAAATIDGERTAVVDGLRTE
ncbi:hypothetical protein CASFOL_028002 [Castilleja foliolosa]|uniref:Uncharacterized protein n=1 Tax=Castilleja foliolosa TaxID=1961234 RepID=A0ABD3CGH1_9LAMI